MTNASPEFSQAMTNLVAYLFTRREALLANWRMACEKDQLGHKISTLSREEFDNLLPLVLNILEQRLLGQPEEADPAITAQAHGLHRWHKAHALVETLSELQHLTQSLYDELEAYQKLFPKTDSQLLLRAHRQITQLMNEAIRGSIQKYDDLQRFEASTRTAALQQALDEMDKLSRQRGDILRSSSHDLRGSFGIINSAAYLLKMEGLNQEQREKYLDMLSRNLSNVQSMLTNLMDLSRLEAGAETVKIERVDAAKMLREMIDSAQPIAAERGLVLQGDGPEQLTVETDPIKLQRIIQNLLLNALTYTASGFISVAWLKEGNFRWLFSIQDSGPGLPPTLAGVFGEQFRPTVEPTSVLTPDDAEPVSVRPINVPELPTGGELDEVTRRTKGEGVGLQIVQRLCELLNANLDVESLRGRGTLFRVRMPIHYDS